MAKGGRQPGAGRPKGGLNESTIRKQAVRDYFLKKFEKDAERVYEAQLAQALGNKFLVARDPRSGKFVPLDDAKTKLLLESGQAEIIEIWDRPPSTQAAQFLSDRAIDKPTEHQQISGEGGGALEITWKKTAL